jgi:hypothetical protein
LERLATPLAGATGHQSAIRPKTDSSLVVYRVDTQSRCLRFKLHNIFHNNYTWLRCLVWGLPLIAGGSRQTGSNASKTRLWSLTGLLPDWKRSSCLSATLKGPIPHDSAPNPLACFGSNLVANCAGYYGSAGSSGS